MDIENMVGNRSDVARLPGIAMSRDKLWNPRVDQRSGTTIGYDDPEGKFHPLRLGENLVVERDFNTGNYIVLVKSLKGGG